MYKVGILSDTHNLLRPEVCRVLSGCDRILHAGDVSGQKIVDELERIAPLSVVQGNNDLSTNKEWGEHLPEYQDLTIEGIRIYMCHKKKDLPPDLSGYDLVICGHSHKYEDTFLQQKKRGIRFLNPGSCGPRRFHQEITLAIMMIDDTAGAGSDAQDRVTIEKIRIPHKEQDRKDINIEENKAAFAADLRLKIPAIMKDLENGKSVKQIAARYHLPEELAENIVRMYLTHPGVDAEGILRRIGF